uniref:Uncharacterized protein n=1 Tax=Glossina pallidipes TaxID=7398 RepID=A0A1A9ZV26_GLOPL
MAAGIKAAQRDNNNNNRFSTRRLELLSKLEESGDDVNAAILIPCENGVELLHTANVLISGLSGVGPEITKNVILSREFAVKLNDHRIATKEDFGAQLLKGGTNVAAHHLSEVPLGSTIKLELKIKRLKPLKPLK